MAVYIDNFNAPYGRMKMCHMIADTTDELLQMADRIGVARKWLQDPGQYTEHFDICLSKKALAVQYGAKEITARELSRITCTRPNAPQRIREMAQEQPKEN